MRRSSASSRSLSSIVESPFKAAAETCDRSGHRPGYQRTASGLTCVLLGSSCGTRVLGAGIGALRAVAAMCPRTRARVPRLEAPCTSASQQCRLPAQRSPEISVRDPDGPSTHRCRALFTQRSTSRSSSSSAGGSDQRLRRMPLWSIRNRVGQELTSQSGEMRPPS